MVKEACVVCYPTEMLVAQIFADTLGVPLRVNEIVSASGKFYVLDPLGELDPTQVKDLLDRYDAWKRQP